MNAWVRDRMRLIITIRALIGLLTLSWATSKKNSTRHEDERWAARKSRAGPGAAPIDPSKPPGLLEWLIVDFVCYSYISDWEWCTLLIFLKICYCLLERRNNTTSLAQSETKSGEQKHMSMSRVWARIILTAVNDNARLIDRNYSLFSLLSLTVKDWAVRRWTRNLINS